MVVVDGYYFILESKAFLVFGASSLLVQQSGQCGALCSNKEECNQMEEGQRRW